MWNFNTEFLKKVSDSNKFEKIKRFEFRFRNK